MEKATEQKCLINIEVSRGKELANQLKCRLDEDQKTKKSGEICELLLQKIVSCYEKSLSILNSIDVICEEPLTASSTKPTPQYLTNTSGQSHQIVQRKRKALPQWSEQAQLSELDDGYSWRKYGQKPILGATFPRSYFRCTHRHTQGCLATKQVQKSDEDSVIFVITFKGIHTCNRKLSTAQKQGKTQKEAEIQKQQNEMLVQRFPSFSFVKEMTNTENNIFGEDNSRPYSFEGASEFNSFSLPAPCNLANFGTYKNLQHLESCSSTKILSAPNSVTNSPIGSGNMSLSPDEEEFDPDDFLNYL